MCLETPFQISRHLNKFTTCGIHFCRGVGQCAGSLSLTLYSTTDDCIPHHFNVPYRIFTLQWAFSDSVVGLHQGLSSSAPSIVLIQCHAATSHQPLALLLLSCTPSEIQTPSIWTFFSNIPTSASLALGISSIDRYLSPTFDIALANTAHFRWLTSFISSAKESYCSITCQDQSIMLQPQTHRASHIFSEIDSGQFRYLFANSHNII